jgi:Domain of unknown function (DUF4926)
LFSASLADINMRQAATLGKSYHLEQYRLTGDEKHFTAYVNLNTATSGNELADVMMTSVAAFGSSNKGPRATPKPGYSPDAPTPAPTGKPPAATTEPAIVSGTGGSASNTANQVKPVEGAIPNASNAVIDPAKLTSYALDPNHPVGGNKAIVFESALGYNQSNAGQLSSQIQDGILKYPAVPGKTDAFGQRFTVDMPITGPNGNTVVVRTGWIVEPGSKVPRLTTTYIKWGFMNYELFDVVVLTLAFKSEGLEIGSVGTIVEIYKEPHIAYEVEFCDSVGKTLAQLALTPDLFRPYK